MNARIKSLAKKVLPQSVHHNVRELVKNGPRIREKRETQRIFSAAPDQPSYLDGDALEMLQNRYPFPPKYGWDPKSIDLRGSARAAELLSFPGGRQAGSFLEIGCWDGMVSCHLARKGKRATAIDYRDIGFDERASRQGVQLMKMDAANMQFEDEQFDFVFSYDAFEHVASPEDVLFEAARVIKKGGYLYLDFGPLYYSPFGEHAYDSITVPYCQFLFPKEVINHFAVRKGLKPIDFSHVNGWSLVDYRNLWQKYSRVLRPVRCYESTELSHLDVIKKYPSCFRSKSDSFDNFVVDSVKILFRKTGT